MGCTGSAAVAAEPRRPDRKRFHELYTLGRKLGAGAFGQVRAARPRAGAEGGEVAVKIVDVSGLDGSGQPTREVDRARVSGTRTEIQVWQMVGVNEHCVRLQAAFFEKTLFYMVMEKCDCSLLDRLGKMQSMTEAVLVRIFAEMLLGIEHVHSVGVVHRDIKPDNFLLRGTTVKLCDFGLAAQMPAKGLLAGVCGTAPYMSPEMLRSAGYDMSTDIWSYGATAFLMFHGDFPYSPRQATGEAMKRAIAAGRPEIKFVPDEEPFFSTAFVARATPFLQGLLQRTPAMRQSATEAVQLLLSLDRQSSKNKVTISATEMPLAPAIFKARQATLEFKAPANPTVQRNLDELLHKLQNRPGGSAAAAAMCFSESCGGEDLEDTLSVKAEPSDGRIRRRSETRHSTHSGVVSDAASTATPGSGSGGDSGRSAGSGPSCGSGRPRAGTVPGPA